MIQRIRMLKGVARKYNYISEGTVLRVPEHIDEATALSWLSAGLAAEDKMIDRIPETKAEVVDEKPVKKGKGKRS